jgi:hypothetical protein
MFSGFSSTRVLPLNSASLRMRWLSPHLFAKALRTHRRASLSSLRSSSGSSKISRTFRRSRLMNIGVQFESHIQMPLFISIIK